MIISCCPFVIVKLVLDLIIDEQSRKYFTFLVTMSWWTKASGKELDMVCFYSFGHKPNDLLSSTSLSPKLHIDCVMSWRTRRDWASCCFPISRRGRPIVQCQRADLGEIGWFSMMGPRYGKPLHRKWPVNWDGGRKRLPRLFGTLFFMFK